MFTAVSAIGVLVLVLAHIFVNKLNLSYIPRSKWLSTAGGISVSYIFVHVLPELAEFQSHIRSNGTFSSLQFLENHIYLFALMGLTVFYGLERVAKKSSGSHRSSEEVKEGDDDDDDVEVFWTHMVSFGIYNFLIGYLLLQRENTELNSLIVFIIAMAFHFIVNDYALLDHYRKTYLKKGRWIIIFPLIFGWLIALFTELPKNYLAVMFAFVAGGVIMNVLKEELPEERKSNYPAFLFGVVSYTILLLLIK